MQIKFPHFDFFVNFDARFWGVSRDIQAGKIAIKYREQKSRKRCELKLSDNLVVSLSTASKFFLYLTPVTPPLLPLSCYPCPAPSGPGSCGLKRLSSPIHSFPFYPQFPAFFLSTPSPFPALDLFFPFFPLAFYTAGKGREGCAASPTLSSPRFLCAFCARACRVRPRTYTYSERTCGWRTVGARVEWEPYEINEMLTEKKMRGKKKEKREPG